MNREHRFRWRTPVMLAALGLGSIFAGFSAHNANQDGRLIAERQLLVQNLAQSDARLNSAILDVRHGHTSNFDTLVEALEANSLAITTLCDVMDEDATCVDEQRLTEEATALATLVNSKRTQIERFKSQSAILGNFQRYIPRLAEEATLEIAHLESAEQISLKLVQIVMLGMDTAHSRDRRATFDDLRLDLDRELRLALAPPASVQKLMDLASHVERACAVGSRTDDLMQTALTTPVDAQRQRLRDTLQEHQKRTLVSAARYREVLLFVVGALLAVSLHSWFRLRHRHQLMRDDNELLEARIQERTADLERASRAKSDFVANMSHEIRTPMTAILGYADVLREPAFATAERDEAIDSIHRNGQFLLAVLNDILDLSKIESGHMTAEALDTDPVAQIENVREMMLTQADRQGLELRMRWPDLVPSSIQTDPIRWTQILVNLVGNALKFTRSGHVELAVDFDPEEPGSLSVRVRDTGIGIEPDRLPGLFHAFTQADTSTTRRFGGTGLDLAISSRLATLLGGELTASSTPGVGSEFRATIATGIPSDAPNDLFVAPRLRRSSQAATETEGRPTPRKGHVLLVEDGRDNQLLISRMLRKRGLDVSLAENGREACDTIRDRGHDGFDLILLDMQMPVMDGYAAAAELRGRGTEIPIVAITAHAMETDRQRCLDAGCDDYLSKPVDRGALEKILGQFLARD